MSEQTAVSYDPTELGKDVPTVEAGTPLVDEEGIELPTFDPKYTENFVGLLYLGALTDSFDWLGHRFVIRTLRDGELLAVAQIIRPYMETMGADRAYAMAIAAMCVMSVDGEELPVPIGETKRANEWGHQRFEYIKNNWFAYTTTEVFNRYMRLDDLANQVVAALGKASAPEDSTPSSNAI